MREEVRMGIMRIDGLEWSGNAPLSHHTTFRIGGPAEVVAYPKDSWQLEKLLSLCSRWGEIPLILGNGSNVLAPDEGVERLVVCTKGMQEITIEGNTLTFGAGVTMAKAANTALAQGLTGMEFAHGIPGTIGGGAVMNAGAYGGELKDIVLRVTALDMAGNEVVKEGEDLGFRYRHSFFCEEALVITSVTVKLQPGDKDAIKARMEELAGKRRASQPLEYPSAGSTFKRPTGYYAAALIQDCGLKGLTVGGAQVSEKHSGFVINKGGATCRDVLELTDKIKTIVKEQTGVELELEVKLLSPR